MKIRGIDVCNLCGEMLLLTQQHKPWENPDLCRKCNLFFVFGQGLLLDLQIDKVEQVLLSDQELIFPRPSMNFVN